jgi:hypothetical protein
MNAVGRLLLVGSTTIFFIGTILLLFQSIIFLEGSPKIFSRLQNPLEICRIWLRGFTSVSLITGFIVLIFFPDDVRYALTWLGGARDFAAVRERGRRRALRGHEGLLRPPNRGLVGAAAVGDNRVHIGGRNRAQMNALIPPAPNGPIVQPDAAIGGVGGVVAVEPVALSRRIMQLVSVKLIVFDLWAGLLEGYWDSRQIGHLDKLWDILVWPLFRDIVLLNSLFNMGEIR